MIAILHDRKKVKRLNFYNKKKNKNLYHYQDDSSPDTQYKKDEQV